MSAAFSDTDRALRVTLSVSCLYGIFGVAMPFLGRWLEVERGLEGAAIGAVLSLAQLARVFISPAFALWADRTADRRTPLRVLALGAFVSHLVFLFWAQGFWALLISGFVALSFSQSAAPFVEAAALRATRAGKINYGLARGMGSVSFILANVVGGLLVARFGAGAVALWLIGAIGLFALSNWFALRPDPAPLEARAEPALRKDLIRALLRAPRYWIIVIGAGLIQASHAYFYGFSAILWGEQGVAEDMTGLLWGFGVALEVGFLFALPWFERRLSPEALVLAGAAGGVTRWLIMGFAPTGFMLWPLQALHVLSFAATHVGAMRLLMRVAPEAVHGLSQSIYSGLSMGLLMGAATLMSGVLYEHVGAGGYWFMAALAGAGGAISLGLLRSGGGNLSRNGRLREVRRV